MANHEPIGNGRPSAHRQPYRTPSERGRVQMYVWKNDRVNISEDCRNLGLGQVDASEMLAILLHKAVSAADERKLTNSGGNRGQQTDHHRRQFWRAIFQVIVASWKEIVDMAVPVMENLVAEEHREMVERSGFAKLMKSRRSQDDDVNPVDAAGG